MSSPREAQEAPAKQAGFKATERIEGQGPGPGRGPMGGGMVGQKAMDFGPSAKRLLARMRPDRGPAVLVVLLGVVSVALMSTGPRILGHATDLVFAGLFSSKIPAGSTQDAGGRGAARPRRRQPRRHAGGDGPRGPRPGRRLRRRRSGAAAGARGVRRGVAAGVDAGLHPQRGRAEHRPPDAPGRRGEDPPAAAGLLRPLAPRRDAQPGHQRHRQHQPPASSRR